MKWPKVPPTEPREFVPEDAPDTLATPEGDNEYLPDEPLSRKDVVTPERPRGDGPHSRQPIRPAEE